MLRSLAPLGSIETPRLSRQRAPDLADLITRLTLPFLTALHLQVGVGLPVYRPGDGQTVRASPHEANPDDSVDGACSDGDFSTNGRGALLAVCRVVAARDPKSPPSMRTGPLGDIDRSAHAALAGGIAWLSPEPRDRTFSSGQDAVARLTIESAQCALAHAIRAERG